LKPLFPRRRGVLAPRSTASNEKVPGSERTQVTGLNDYGVTVGFW
jgi:hypothetical protein